MKVSPGDENNNHQGTGHGYKEPVRSGMLQSPSHLNTAVSRTRVPNNDTNENSDSPSHKDGQTPTTTSNENEDGGFSEFIAYLRLCEEAQQMQTALGRREGAEDDINKDQWQCATCSYINKNPLHLTCDICGTGRVVQNQELKLKQGKNRWRKQRSLN